MSKLEDALAIQIRALKLPGHERNYKGIPGRKLEFDFAWPALKIAVEVQGGIWGISGHSTGEGISRDCEKACLAVVNGWKLLPVTAKMIKDGRAVEYLKKTHEQTNALLVSPRK